MIKIYNTLTREKEVFQPLEEKKVKMYVCGPTVYNYIHIGNGRSTVSFDTVRRYFEYRGYTVDYLMNFTDVDDKIIRAAKELGTTAPEVAERFINAFNEDTAALNVKPATMNPRVMDHIEDIIAFIAALVEKGYAYPVNGDVYYRTRKFAHYGQLSDQSIDELEVGASQRTGEEQKIKEDPLDFALWKAAKGDEIAWESPWGAGRPGWHIECSVMATKHLGETIDIHGGGQDLTFPHHENEIAQSEAKTGKTFANYWMHNGYVTIGEDEEKMSKSLGNFFTLKDVAKGYDLEVLRFFILSAHYRQPLNFSDFVMEQMKNGLDRIYNCKYKLEDLLDVTKEGALSPGDKEIIEMFEKSMAEFSKAMDDDLNTADAITAVYNLVKDVNTYLKEDSNKLVVEEAWKTLNKMTDILGILKRERVTITDEDILGLIDERETARKTKNYKRADEIRDELLEKGIQLEDTREGVKYRRV